MKFFTISGSGALLEGIPTKVKKHLNTFDELIPYTTDLMGELVFLSSRFSVGQSLTCSKESASQAKLLASDQREGVVLLIMYADQRKADYSNPIALAGEVALVDVVYSRHYRLLLAEMFFLPPHAALRYQGRIYRCPHGSDLSVIEEEAVD